VRRFITSLPGKVIGQVAIAALILPSITLAMFAKAKAQIATQPSWAVTEFVNLKSPGTTYGKTAATDFGNALANRGEIEVVPPESVTRAIETLGITTPPDGLVNLLRLGQEVKATSIVSGEIADYRVQSAGNGRQASVVMRVVVYDVASGLSVNGAALRGVSSIRSGNVDDDTLIKDALEQACNSAMNQIESHRLPVGTVLNTQDTKCLINKGARAGFKSGQEVIVLRNGEQVATGKVTEVEPDSAYIVGSNILRGIQPGDRVRVVFKVPDVDIDNGGNPHIRPVRSTSFPSGLVSVALIIGVVVALVGGGNGGTQNTIANVEAAPFITGNGTGVPGVNITWSTTVFAGGQSQIAAWQIYRNDVIDSPVGVAGQAGTNTSQYSDNYEDLYGAGTAIGALSYALFTANQVGQNDVCNYTAASDTTNAAAIPSIALATPYLYQVQEVYDLLAIDLPNGGSSQTSGGTGGTSTSTTSTSTTTTSTTATGTTGTTGTGTTGATGTTTGTTGTTASTTGSTGTTSGGGGTVCYFLSSKVTAVGWATPLGLPQLYLPAAGGTVNEGQAYPFSTASAIPTGAVNPIPIEYVLELSTSILFKKGAYVQVATFASNQVGGDVQTPGGGVVVGKYPIFANVTDSTPLYWRYGVKNLNDNPGPGPDALTGEHYVFSSPRLFYVTGTPPPPPSAKHKHIGKGKAG
jgi:hypothetical protein